MTPEEKLARDRERWQLKKRRQRARKRSAARAGTTIKVEVWHPEELAGYLVRHNLLGDADSTARIENAIEKMFHWGRTHVHLGHWNSGWAQWLPRRLRPETPASYEIKLDEPIMKSLIDFELGRKEKGVTVPDDFAERLREDATALAQIAQNFLYVLYATDMPPNPPRVACDCKRDIEFCDCHRMWLDRANPHLYGRKPCGDGPRAWSPPGQRGNKMPLTWGCSHWHKYDDEIIRSHARSANEGKRGRFAGTRGERRIENAEYYPHADDRASTRDWNKTAREGEKAIEKPYDATTGTPKSWSNPVDAEPDRAKFEDGHLIDDAEVAPPKPKKGEVEAL